MKFIQAQHIYQQVLRVQQLDKNTGRYVIYLDSSKPVVKKLKATLLILGCFKFFSTNSGEKIIGVSQVVYFLFKNQAAANGWTIKKNFDEIHHLDGDITNNHPSNLIVLSCSDHHLVTNFQKGKFGSSIPEQWLASYSSPTPTRFNNQGKTIKNHRKFLEHVIAKTLLLSVKRWCQNLSTSSSISVKSITDWVRQQLPFIPNLEIAAFQFNKARYSFLTNFSLTPVYSI